MQRLCHRGSAPHCSLTGQRFGGIERWKRITHSWRGERAWERERERRWPACVKFPAGPRRHPRALCEPEHKADYLVAIIRRWCLMQLLWNFKAKQQLIYKLRQLNGNVFCCFFSLRKCMEAMHIKQGQLTFHFQPECFEARDYMHFQICIFHYCSSPENSPFVHSLS